MTDIDRIELVPATSVRTDAVPVAAESKGSGDQPFVRWRTLAILGDLAAAALAAGVARWVTFGNEDVLVTTSSSIELSYQSLGLLCCLVWAGLVAVCGAYDLRTLLVGVEELRRVLRAGISMVAFLGFVVLGFGLLVARGFVVAYVPLTVAFTGLWRLLLRRRMNKRQATGVGHHNVVVVGPTDELESLARRLERTPASALNVVAFVADDEGNRPTTGPLSTVRWLTDRDSIQELRSEGVRIDILVRAGRPTPDEMWVLARRAAEVDAVLAVAPHREDASSHVQVSYGPFGHTPLLVVETPSLNPVSRAIKAVLDRVLGLAILVALLPVLAIISVACLVAQGRPLFFTQERVGRNGRRFRCFKFRTMVNDADELREQLAHLNQAHGPLFKIREDPRVTPIGRFLRAHSLDELPQLLNVLGGSMSLVGPRPPLPTEVTAYNEREARRLLVKPGMTGLWQIEGRSDLPWDDGVYLDLLYVDHWSPLLDLVIIARTARAVLRPAGAY